MRTSVQDDDLDRTITFSKTDSPHFVALILSGFKRMRIEHAHYKEMEHNDLGQKWSSHLEFADDLIDSLNNHLAIILKDKHGIIKMPEDYEMT